VIFSFVSIARGMWRQLETIACLSMQGTQMMTIVHVGDGCVLTVFDLSILWQFLEKA
jgi:hypothetical protein